MGGRSKYQFTIQDLLADKRCSQAGLDSLSATDMGRPVHADEDAGSEMSEWQLRECREREEERRAEAEELGAGRNYRCSYPPPLS